MGTDYSTYMYVQRRYCTRCMEWKNRDFIRLDYRHKDLRPEYLEKTKEAKEKEKGTKKRRNAVDMTRVQFSPAGPLDNSVQYR